MQMQMIFKPAQARTQEENHLPNPLAIEMAPIIEIKSLLIDDQDRHLLWIVFDPCHGIAELFLDNPLLRHQIIARQSQRCSRLSQVSKYGLAKKIRENPLDFDLRSRRPSW